MKDHDQHARASENFAGPVDFETPGPDLPVHFLNFQKPWLTRIESKSKTYYTINMKGLMAVIQFFSTLYCWFTIEITKITFITETIQL